MHPGFPGPSFDRCASSCQKSVQRLLSRELLLRRRGRHGDSGERGLVCLGDVTQQHRGQFLGQRAPKHSSSLGFLWPEAYPRLADVGNSFVGYAKQAGSK